LLSTCKAGVKHLQNFLIATSAYHLCVIKTNGYEKRHPNKNQSLRFNTYLCGFSCTVLEKYCMKTNVNISMLLTGLFLKSYFIVGHAWAYVYVAYQGLNVMTKRKNIKDVPTSVGSRSFSEA